jgi:hypothetical protein
MASLNFQIWYFYLAKGTLLRKLSFYNMKEYDFHSMDLNKIENKLKVKISWY